MLSRREAYSCSHGLVAGHLAVGLNAMFQAVKLPAGVSVLSQKRRRLPTAHAAQWFDFHYVGRDSHQAISKEAGQLLLTWIPAWPMWMLITSRMIGNCCNGSRRIENEMVVCLNLFAFECLIRPPTTVRGRVRPVMWPRWQCA